MNDPNLRFMSSLRSSPGGTSRRSSLSVSPWYSPEETAKKNATPSARSLLRRSLDSSKISFEDQSLNGVFSNRESGHGGSPVPESKLDSRARSTQSLWEPPVSCRRRMIQSFDQTQYHYFFPMELNSRDYYHRAVSLLVDALELLDTNLLRNNRPRSMASSSFEEKDFIHMLCAELPRQSSSEVAAKISLLAQQDQQVQPSIQACLSQLLDAKDQLFQRTRLRYGSCKLVELSGLFQSCVQFVQVVSPYFSSSDGRYRLEKELHALENQLLLHRSCQKERMMSFGWRWDELDNPGCGLDEKWEHSHHHCEKLEEDASHMLTTESSSLLLLVNRLVSLEQELLKISEKAGDFGDYKEAQRLQALALCMQSTVSHENRLLLDRAQTCIYEIGVLIIDFDHLTNSKRNERDFQAAQAAEEASIRLFRLRENLQNLLQSMPLLECDLIQNMINTQGTSFITSNFLFLTEYWFDGLSIAALLIRAASQDLLHAIEQWPELSSLKSSAYCRTQIQRLNLYNGDGYDYPIDLGASDDIVPQIEFGQTLNRQQLDSAHSIEVAALSNSYMLETNSQNSTFSNQVLGALRAFESLQQELEQLITPPARAHSQLICRLIGVSSDLNSLLGIAESGRSSGSTQSREGERLNTLITAIEGSIDADEETCELDEDKAQQTMLYGRKRIDYVWQIISRIKPSIKELMKLKSMARSYHDFTAAATLEAMLLNLEQRVRAVEDSIVSFSILDSDNDTHIYDSRLDVNERVAREGTAFLTADFIFSYSSGNRGHSIGSLAIIAGAGCILRYIKGNWPGLTALGNHSSEAQSMNPSNSTRKSGRAQSLIGGIVNFHDANSLRILGFDPQTMKVAGFSTVDILTAGYTAEELKTAGFDAQSLHEAAGMSSIMLHQTSSVDNSASASGGHALEVTAQLLQEFYFNTSGSAWKKSPAWKELDQLLQTAQNSFTKPNGQKLSIFTYHNELMSLFAKLFGTEMDRSYEVVKLILPHNSLSGALPVSIGSFASLQDLVLSNNRLVGPIPASIGLLTHLKSLVLDHNQLEGEIPRTIKQLQNLVILKLECNQLEGLLPPSLGNLTKLRRLDLSYNQFSGPLPSRLGVSGQMQLQELILNNNALEGEVPETWGQLVRLTHVDLRDNKLSGALPASISQLAKLTGLNLANNPLLQVNRQQLQKALPRCKIIS